MATSSLCVAIIASGLLYIRKREVLHDADVQAIYRQTNLQFFQGTLPNVSVEWADLSELHAAGVADSDWRGEIIGIRVDRAANPTMQDLIDTVRHETCHAFVLPRAEENPHGEGWGDCMQRFL